MSRIRVLSCVVLSLVAACASVKRKDLLVAEGNLARQTIREAEVTGAARSPTGGESLARAKAAVAYAERLPGDPDHAKRLYMRAQVDAELALVLTRRTAQERIAARCTPAVVSE